jgi:hypothetical protein
MSQEGLQSPSGSRLAGRISSDLLTGPSSQDSNRRHLPSIGRNKLGIPLPCPQICDRTGPVVAKARSAHVRGPAVAGQAQGKRNRGRGPDLDLAAAALGERMKGKR